MPKFAKRYEPINTQSTMKRIIPKLVLLLALLLSATAHAHDFEVDGIYYNINGTNATVTFQGTSVYQYSNEYTGRVIIPSAVRHNGTSYPVTSIGGGAFSECTSLISVNIPNSITSIGDGAFSGCTSLTSVNIPNFVTSIGGGAFAFCSSLTSIVIPNSVANLGNGDEYYWEVFYGCTSLTDVTIGDSVTEIGSYMFYECKSLKNIHIGNSVTSIGGEAFSGCTALSIVDIANLDAWCRISFDGTCLDDHWPSPYNPFYYANHLYVNGAEITDLIIPESVSYIGDYLFECCPGLNSVTIPNTVTSIGWGAFYGCTGLTSVMIPNSITFIGWDSFYGCTSIKDLYIGDSVETILGAAFNDCTSLSNIYCFSAIPPTYDTSIGVGEYALFSDYSATLHVPAASLAAYFTAPEWSKFENIVGDAIETTGISISRDSIEIHSGEQIELTATITPANASCKEVTWYSTNTSVATVENGQLTAKGIGECDIIAYCMGMPAICHISVSNRINLEQQEAMLLPNHMLVLTPIAPAMPAGFTVTSSDPSVAAARVMNGKVQIVGIKEGTTTITVASSDGTAQAATCLVTVYTESGDANCDGFVNISDVTSLIDYLLGSETAGFKEGNADLNGDGNVNISDVTELIDHLLSASD